MGIVATMNRKINKKRNKSDINKSSLTPCLTPGLEIKSVPFLRPLFALEIKSVSFFLFPYPFSRRSSLYFMFAHGLVEHDQSLPYVLENA